MRWAPLIFVGTLLLPGGLALAGDPSGTEGGTGVEWRELAPASAATARIEGRVIVHERPARRTADRYPGAGAAAARDLPPVPVVVHLEGAAGAAIPSNQPRLAQRDTAFAPSLLVVPIGTDVAFPNEDPFLHNVFSYSRPTRFDLGRYPQGESRSVTLDRPGYLKVFCEVHEWMRGAILVVDGPHYAIVEADGSFTLVNVPAGRYTLVATHFDRGRSEVEVEVGTGETVRVEIEVGR